MPCDEWKKAVGIDEDPAVFSPLPKITPVKKLQIDSEEGTMKSMINLSSDEEDDNDGSITSRKRKVGTKKLSANEAAKAAWVRMRDRNKKSLFSDKDKDNLSAEEKALRKKAKTIGIHMIKNQKDSVAIMEYLSDGMDLSSGKYCSQTLANRYYNLYMSDDEN